MAKKPTAKKKGDGGKRAARDRTKKAASATKGTKAVKAAKKSEPDKSEGARKVIGERELRSLAADVQQAMNRSAEQGGVAGQLISDAVKKKGLNAPAFRIALRLKRVGERDPAKLRILLDDVDYYRDILKLDDLAGESLFAPREGAQEEGDEGDESPQEPAGDNVVNLNNGNGSEQNRPAA